MAKSDWYRRKWYTIPATGDKRYAERENTWGSKVTNDTIMVEVSRTFAKRSGVIRAGYRGGQSSSRMVKTITVTNRFREQIPGSPEFPSVKAALAWMKNYMATHRGIGITDNDPLAGITH